MKILISFLLLIQITTNYGQMLPRQGAWGIYAVQLADSSQKSLKLQKGALEIKWLQPNGAEAEIGLQMGDVLLRINEHRTESPSDIYFSGYLNQLRSGEKVCYHLIRENKKLKLCGKIKPKPYETHPKVEVIYGKVKFKNGHLSTIITKPNKAEKLPAIYFIPGYNCASYDNMSPIHPYRRIIDSLSNLGYAVFRCEKSGMGDSYNTPNCFEIDFHTEQLGFEAGYQKLLTYDFIDSSQIFIFGHSLGGINAPLIAKKYNPKGVIVYGTTHLPWMEYLQNMLRFQNSHLGISPLEMERDAIKYQSLLYEHYVLKLSLAELLQKDSAYLPLLQRDFQYIGGDMVFQRHYSFMQQLNDLHLSKSWASVKSNVLSIYGGADFEALNPDSHREIARIVNYYHPDKASFLLLPETNHSFIKVGSMEEGVKARTNGTMRSLMVSHFNYEIITEIDQWIQSLK